MSKYNGHKMEVHAVVVRVIGRCSGECYCKMTNSQVLEA